MLLKYLKPSKLSVLSNKPGVYVFYDKNKKPLYIGKASNLKKRIKSHFLQPSYKGIFFIKKIQKIGYVSLKSDIEALILESKFIKKYQPKFNVSFRDDKKYFYVGITKEKWPRLFITHQPIQIQNRAQKKSKIKQSKNTQLGSSYVRDIEYIGPFTDGRALKTTLKILRKIFPYRDCKSLPKKPCLWYQINRCPAPCLIEKELKIRKTLKKETELRKRNYIADIKKIRLILKGEKHKLISNLTRQMKDMSKLEEFEKAAKLRDQITSLERIYSHRGFLTNNYIKIKKNVGVLLKEYLNLQSVPKRIEGYDVSNIRSKEMVGSMVVFRLSKNYNNEKVKFSEKYIPDKTQYRRFKIKTVKKQNDTACLREIVSRRLSHREWKFPDLIYVDGGKAQLNAVKKMVSIALQESLKKEIPVISLAKKRNILYNSFSDDSLPLDNLPQEVKMTFLYLRDESHRFAISYHKKLRGRTFLLL